jgi:hypothetical protein
MALRTSLRREAQTWPTTAKTIFSFRPRSSIAFTFKKILSQEAALDTLAFQFIEGPGGEISHPVLHRPPAVVVRVLPVLTPG